MRHLCTYRYIYSEEARSMSVEYVDGAVTVVDNNGNTHNLTYENGIVSGPGQLAATHRNAIAALISKAIEELEAAIAWTNL